MKGFGLDLLIFATGILCGLWLNWKEPIILKAPAEKPPETTVIQFNSPKSVYLTVDGNAFRLSVDGQWDGLTFQKEETIKLPTQK